MPDVKEVIKGLEEMLEDSKYNDSVNWNPWADTETLEDAIALLKAQEPVNPMRKHGKRGWFFYCPKCETILNDMAKPKYCSECGQAVKWE